ncbi:MAG: hypothetical protein IJ111_09210 [Eggerthellaceae bacterium]|nr:hypothetical protein [Eggerthellaceae bacterium]
MTLPTHAQAFEVLLLQAADEGRDAALFGGAACRVRDAALPFLIGEKFPEIYLEFPLAGEPFLDVTLLYGELDEDARIDSALAAGCEDIISFYARERAKDESIGFGFEIDCSGPVPSAAGVHFQPRSRTDLVAPFCEAVGSSGKAALYLSQDERMAQGWPLAFFGMFRGRADSPLRVCGYLKEGERHACAADPDRLARALEQAGFTAYDEAMLAQAACVLGLAPADADFQLDVLGDGSLGDMFAIDVRFDSMSSEDVCKSFANGAGAAIMAKLREWGIADERMAHVADMAFTRGVDLWADDGSCVPFGFTLVPGWLKVRWRGGVLQPAKMYMKASAGPVVKEGAAVKNE